MNEAPKSPVRLFSYEDDRPQIARGSLIPQKVIIDEVTVQKTPNGWLLSVRRVAKVTIVPVVTVAALALVVFSGFNLATLESQEASVPSITLYDPYSASRSVLSAGPQPAFSQATIFFETRDALIEEQQSFLEIDIPAQSVRYFTDGVLVEQAEAIAVGATGSWWDIPSGLYEVASLKEKHFSPSAQIYFPWAILFEGNYLLHGSPEHADGTTVADDYVGGGVRLTNEEAERLYEAVEAGDTVIVRGHAAPPKDDFVFEPNGPSITAPQYIVADLETATILTAEGIDKAVPIASLTKLMTAVVTAEKLSLEERVYAAEPTFVESLVPRLQERSSVSMYSLLQLLLLESSNEAAEVLAAQYGRGQFIAEMNNKARLLGMFDTAFADPSGLSAENTSTVKDLLKLTRYIHQQRNFIFEVTADGEAVGVLGGGDFTDLLNFNNPDDTPEYVGGKIGETEAAGQTSISLHQASFGDESRIVAVIVLGSSARSADVAALLDFVTQNYNQ